MKGTTGHATTDWLEFIDPDPERKTAWVVHLPFLLSKWSCLYGQGCPGLFGTQEKHIYPDLGCCGKGVHMNSKAEMSKLQSEVELLTEEDIGPKGLAYIRKHGWNVQLPPRPGDNTEDEDYTHFRTRVRDGGCVFAKRADDGDEKTGCAFVHLAARLRLGIHMDVMPDACWQLPIGHDLAYDEERDLTVRNIMPWDADYWGGKDDDGTHDSWMSWWCIDAPDAYQDPDTLPIYLKMELELRNIMSDAAYERMVELIEQRMGNYVEPMPGAVRNEGRPMLPLLVGNRTPKRQPRSCHHDRATADQAAAAD